METAGVTHHGWELGNPVEWAKANARIPVGGSPVILLFSWPMEKTLPIMFFSPVDRPLEIRPFPIR